MVTAIQNTPNHISNGLAKAPVRADNDCAPEFKQTKILIIDVFESFGFVMHFWSEQLRQH